MGQIMAAHSAVLQADPSLQAEGQALQQKVMAYKSKVQAAMIKANPKLGPLLAKYKIMQTQYGQQSTVTSSP